MTSNVFHETQERNQVFNSIPTLCLTTPPPLFHVQEQENNIGDDDDKYFKGFPPGFKFVPTNCELIVCYLERKLKNLTLPRNKITDANVYEHHPQHLAERFKHKIQQNYLYLFTPRDKKYKNGSRPNRAAGNGYWKATGADKEVKHNDNLVGYRKSLVYYEGKPPKGRKTNWIMHEFRMSNPPKPVLGSNNMKLDDWVLCRISEKNERHSAKNTKLNLGADNSQLFGQFNPAAGLLHYPNHPTGFNRGHNVQDANIQLDSGDYADSIWNCNSVAAEETLFPFNSNIYTGIFDEIDPSSYMLNPGPGLPAFPPSEFDGNQARIVPMNSSDNPAPVSSDNSEVVDAHFQHSSSISTSEDLKRMFS